MNTQDIFSQFCIYLLTEKRVSQNTFEAYKRDIHQFVVFCEYNKWSFDTIVLKNLKDFLKYLYDLNISTSSMVRKISSLRVFFAYLSERRDIKNIAAQLLFPKAEKKLPRYLTEKEIETLFDIVAQDNSLHAQRNRAMIYLLYATGMRISELIKLTLSDFHFDSEFVGVQGKGGKQRHIPVPASILLIVKDYLESEKRLIEDKKSKKRTSYLFTAQYGKKITHMSRQSFWVILKELWKKTGSKNSISPHKLRHSFATHMLKNGADLRSLQLLLGHENLSTVQIYTHVEKSYLRKVYDKKHSRS